MTRDMPCPGSDQDSAKPPVLVLMGVSGSGKTTVARRLAKRLGWPFMEGDALHPERNVAKMHSGEPLTDADRMPWLEAVGDWIDAQRARQQPGIITCSALKRSYRRIITAGRPEVRLIYLRGSQSLIHERLVRRHGHFMPENLLRSQLDTLEEPLPEEYPIVVEIDRSVDRIVAEIMRQLGDTTTMKSVT